MTISPFNKLHFSRRRLQFTRAETYEGIAPEGEEEEDSISIFRTQSSDWMYDHEDSVIKRISKRLEVLLGLNVLPRDVERRGQDALVESEALQIGIYGPGGVFLPHVDAFLNEDVSQNVQKILFDVVEKV